MARQKGIIRLEGPLGDLSFYSSVFGNIVRRKGGASKEKIRHSPAFRNLRKHHAEFADCAAAGKLLRQGWLSYTRQAPDHTLVWRVTQLMNRVKDLDTSSEWGKRTVSHGLRSKEATALLQGFELNTKSPLKSLLKMNVTCKNQRFYLKQLVPKQHIVFPKGATQACLTALISVVDPAKKKHELYTDQIILERHARQQDVVLAPPVGKGKGFVIYLLQLRFGQLVNGSVHDLKEGAGFAIVGTDQIV